MISIPTIFRFKESQVVSFLGMDVLTKNRATRLNSNKTLTIAFLCRGTITPPEADSVAEGGHFGHRLAQVSMWFVVRQIPLFCSGTTLMHIITDSVKAVNNPRGAAIFFSFTFYFQKAFPSCRIFMEKNFQSAPKQNFQSHT